MMPVCQLRETGVYPLQRVVRIDMCAHADKTKRVSRKKGGNRTHPQ